MKPETSRVHTCLHREIKREREREICIYECNCICVYVYTVFFFRLEVPNFQGRAQDCATQRPVSDLREAGEEE